MVLSVFLTVPFEAGAVQVDKAEISDTYTSGDYEYIVLSDGTAEITGYTGLATILTIPSKLGEYKVTGIGSHAFYWCSSLTSITIPDTIIIIGDHAFNSCFNLTSITMPNSVTSIGRYAFSNCYDLTSITIPNSVISIGDGAFADCDDLTSITIPKGVTSLGDYAFADSDNLTLITIYSKDCTIKNNSIPSDTKIYCLEGSTAHEYAVNNGNEYEFITCVPTVLGDVDGDDTVTVMDATMIQRHIAQLSTIPEDRLACADTDKDTRISIMDATMIQRFIAQLIPEL